jgi:CHAD domain-containing protein
MGNAITAVQRTLAAQLRDEADELARALPAAIGGEVRGVHRARVAARRLSEALPIAQAAVGDDHDRDLRRDVRRMRRALGGTRELDVVRTLLAQEALDRGWSAALVEKVDARCARRRDAARDQLRRRLAHLDPDALPKRLKRLADDLERARPSARAEALLATRLRTRARHFGRVLTATGTLYSPEQLHAARIAGKKLRYTLELARTIARLPVSNVVRDLRAAQDLLGGLRDLQMLQRQLAAVSADRGTDPATMRVFDDWHRELDASCRERHAAFVEMLPALDRLGETLAAELPLRLAGARPHRMAAMTSRRRVRSRRQAASGE